MLRPSGFLPPLVLAVAILPGSTARAGNNDQAAIGLHVTPVVQKGVCEAVDGLITQATLVSEARP